MLTPAVYKAVSIGIHVPGGAVEVGGASKSRTQLSRMSSEFLLVYLSGDNNKIVAWCR